MDKNSRVPTIRYKGFTDAWEQRKLGDIMTEQINKTSDFDNNPLFSLTIEKGITPKTERYERSFLVQKKEELFKIVRPGEFVTNPMNLRFGALGYNQNAFNISVSGYYDVFSIDNNECSSFWNSYFRTPLALAKFDNAATGSLIEKRRVKYSTLKELDFWMPVTIEEKKKIALYFKRLDDLITLHQRKYDKLMILKKSMLEKMFPKNGSNVPEIRFEGFTEDWEQRKLGDIVDRVTRKNQDLESTLPLTISAQYGLVDQITFFNNRVASKDVSGYYLVKKGEFAYNKSTSSDAPWGAIKRLDRYEKGVLSTLYIVFSIKDEAKTDSDFIVSYYMTDNWYKDIQAIAAEGARNHGLLNIAPNDFFETKITIPQDIAEQELIGRYFKQLDELITLHQRKCMKYTELKKTMFQQMFV